MHKSAMQHIQQIPRVPLGGGPSGPGNIGAESKPHQCQQCLKSFSSNHQLVQHIRVHTGEKPYKCSYCDRRFKQLSHVQQHTRLHTGERPYKCHLPDCGRAFIQLSNLQQHLRNHDAQVERAKNRPFHCNICGKGFATESSLRTHTSKELQLHLGVLQQHAALIGGPNATSCPMCHKLFLGTEAMLEHMKHAHKDPSFSSLTNHFRENIGSTCQQSSNDPYLAKRRSANHPCPVCGKNYVNEGSLRKHLACHPETSQLSNSLRMWPCSVCQAVFTHETGLLTHMEHMRMDPKHQFAAQYVLSRAAAERRERESILAATLSVSASGTCTSILPMTGDGGSNSMCPSPSVNSDCSSNGHLSSSAGSEQESGIHILNDNNNSNNNNNCSSSSTAQYGIEADLHANRMSLMAASAVAAAAAVAASASGGDTGMNPSSGCKDTTTPSGSAAVQAVVVNLAAAMRMNQVNTSVAASVATATSTCNIGSISNDNSSNNVLNHVSGVEANNENILGKNIAQAQQINPSSSATRDASPSLSTAHKSESGSGNAVAAMNAMRDTMMRHSSINVSSGVDALGATVVANQPNNTHTHVHQQLTHHVHSHHNVQHRHHTQQQNSPEAALRIQQQAEAILRSHTEVAYRLAATVAASNGNSGCSVSSVDELTTKLPYVHHQQQGDKNIANNNGNSTECNVLHGNSSGGNNEAQQLHQNTTFVSTQDHQQQQQHLPLQLNVPSLPQHQQHSIMAQQQQQPDISEAIRLQEHRIEQALRLHNDVCALNFLTAATAGNNATTAVSATHPHQQHQQQASNSKQEQQTHHTP